MRRLQALLVTAGLLATPVGAVAKPSDPPSSDSWLVERFEWSTSKGRLGVMVMSLTDELRTHFGSADKTGVLVARVQPGSPAAMAGIAVGDVIVEVRGAKVDDAGDIITALAGAKASVQVKLLRDKKPLSLEVKLEGTATSTLEQLPALQWLRELFGLPARQTSTSA